MALYIKISFPDKSSRIIRSRDLFVPVGFDKRGVITSNSPSKLLFALYSVGRDYALISYEPSLKVNNKETSPKEAIKLTGDDKVEVNELTFLISWTLPEAEALINSVSNEELLDQTAKVLRYGVRWILKYGIANLERSVFLPDDIEFSLGSSQTDSIFFNSEGIMPSHLTLKAGREGLIAAPKNGEILINGEKADSLQTIHLRGVITLLPQRYKVLVEKLD